MRKGLKDIPAASERSSLLPVVRPSQNPKFQGSGSRQDTGKKRISSSSIKRSAIADLTSHPFQRKLLISTGLAFVLMTWSGYLGFLLGTGLSIFSLMCAVHLHQVMSSSVLSTFPLAWRKRAKHFWVAANFMVILLLAVRVSSIKTYYGDDFPTSCYPLMFNYTPVDCLHVGANSSIIAESHGFKAPHARTSRRAMEDLITAWVNEDVFQSNIQTREKGYLHATVLSHDIFAQVQCVDDVATVEVHMEGRVPFPDWSDQVRRFYKLMDRVQDSELPNEPCH